MRLLSVMGILPLVLGPERSDYDHPGLMAGLTGLSISAVIERCAPTLHEAVGVHLCPCVHFCLLGESNLSGLLRACHDDYPA